MRGSDGARDPVVRHLRHLGRLGLGEIRVGRDHADDRVGFGRKGKHTAAKNGFHHFQRVGKITRLPKMDRTHVRGTKSRDDLIRFRVHHIAESIDRDQRADDDAAAAYGQAGRADTRFHGLLRPEHLPHRSARPRAEVALARRVGRGAGRGLVAHLGVRAAVGAAHCQVEENGGGDNRHFGDAGVESDLLLLEVAHHAPSRVEAKSGAARQKYRVNLFNEVERIQQVGLARAGRAAAHVHARDRALAAQDHAAAGQRLVILRLPNLDAWHVGDRVVQFHAHPIFPGRLPNS